MRIPPLLTKSVEPRNGSVFLCDLRGAQACVWVMFVLLVAAVFKMNYIHKKLPTTKTGLQRSLIFVGKSIHLARKGRTIQ